MTCKRDKINLLTHRNSVGGDIVMRPFVRGWVSECVCACVHWSVRFSICQSHFVMLARYNLQFMLDQFQTSHVNDS